MHLAGDLSHADSLSAEELSRCPAGNGVRPVCKEVPEPIVNTKVGTKT